jgi:uncharacterized protein affecting Mg2+/Co2+ transport
MAHVRTRNSRHGRAGRTAISCAEESKPDEGRFVWAYTIEIENRREDP